MVRFEPPGTENEGPWMERSQQAEIKVVPNPSIQKSSGIFAMYPDILMSCGHIQTQNKGQQWDTWAIVFLTIMIPSSTLDYKVQIPWLSGPSLRKAHTFLGTEAYPSNRPAYISCFLSKLLQVLASFSFFLPYTSPQHTQTLNKVINGISYDAFKLLGYHIIIVLFRHMYTAFRAP